MERPPEQWLFAPETPKLLETSAHFFKEKSYAEHANPQVRGFSGDLQSRTANPFQKTSDPYRIVGAITGGGRGARLGVPPLHLVCIYAGRVLFLGLFWCRFGAVSACFWWCVVVFWCCFLWCVVVCVVVCGGVWHTCRSALRRG